MVEYVRVWNNVTKARLYYHRVKMEKKLGRKLRRSEVVHHKNGDRRDNRIRNLEVMSLANHSRIHARGRTMCNVDGCGQIAHGRELCNKHYARLLKFRGGNFRDDA